MIKNRKIEKIKDSRNVTDKKHWTCVDCGKDTFLSNSKDYYMVTHELWKKYGVGDGMLCMDCMEDRLGHKLTTKDILDCPLNTIINDYTMQILSNERI